MSAKAKTNQEQVARLLCEFMDDDWSLGRKLYMSTALEIMDVLGVEVGDASKSSPSPNPKKRREAVKI